MADAKSLTRELGVTEIAHGFDEVARLLGLEPATV